MCSFIHPDSPSAEILLVELVALVFALLHIPPLEAEAPLLEMSELLYTQLCESAEQHVLESPAKAHTVSLVRKLLSGNLNSFHSDSNTN